jgi:hypothetical protein
MIRNQKERAEDEDPTFGEMRAFGIENCGCGCWKINEAGAIFLQRKAMED